MTNKEIMQASLLDIIFENRNKAYGAYALRNEYDRRLIKALLTGLGIVLLLIGFNFIRFSGSSVSNLPNEKNGYKLVNVAIEPEKQSEPEKLKETEKPKPAQIDYQTPVITEDNKVKDPLPDNSDANDRIISNTNTDGPPNNQNIVSNTSNDGNGGDKPVDPKPEETTPPVKIYQRDPQFPGGFEALSEFLRKNLISPEELEIGERKIVKVKFIVGRDGTITDITILESPGRVYDKEVSRVVKRMPKWEPAIQNDINVAVGYVLPVTFMGVEE